MTLNEVIHILENKILSLEQQKAFAVNNGDLDKVIQLEQEIEDTKVVLEKLKA